jgi:predicted nucleic acid-binding protein
MALLLDTSVLVASLDPADPHHTACDRLLAEGGHHVAAHALVEAFSMLTSGRLKTRLRPADAAALIEDSVLPYVSAVSLTARETMALIGSCERRGARGGAIYDAAQLAAARKAGAHALVTLDLHDLETLRVEGDPPVRLPQP